MKVKINNELGYTELIIEEEIYYEEDYQMAMLRECEIESIVKVLACGVDENSRYVYDVSGMSSLSQIFEKDSLREEEIRSFCGQLLEAIKEVKSYMLDVNKILLDPDYVYRKGEKYYFCYYPLGKGDVTKTFHTLTEFFVKRVDYNHIETVQLVCDLHKKTMEDNYELNELLENHCLVNVDEDIESMDKIKDDLWISDIYSNKEDEEEEKEGDGLLKKMKYSLERDDHIGDIVRESPFKKWFEKKPSKAKEEFKSAKREKVQKKQWGDWDDLIKGQE